MDQWQWGSYLGPHRGDKELVLLIHGLGWFAFTVGHGWSAMAGKALVPMARRSMKHPVQCYGRRAPPLITRAAQGRASASAVRSWPPCALLGAAKPCWAGLSLVCRRVGASGQPRARGDARLASAPAQGVWKQAVVAAHLQRRQYGKQLAPPVTTREGGCCAKGLTTKAVAAVAPWCGQTAASSRVLGRCVVVVRRRKVASEPRASLPRTQVRARVCLFGVPAAERMCVSRACARPHVRMPAQ